MLGFSTTVSEMYIFLFMSVVCFLIQVVILRWVFRIDKIVEVLTDQASLLEDIKEELADIKNPEKLLKIEDIKERIADI